MIKHVTEGQTKGMSWEVTKMWLGHVLKGQGAENIDSMFYQLLEWIYIYVVDQWKIMAYVKNTQRITIIWKLFMIVL